MNTEINYPEPKSGFEFTKKEKAYHVYQFTLQKRNYGIGLREYARNNQIKRETLRSWIDRYPGGKPYYNADVGISEPQAAAKENCQIVKLSHKQLTAKTDITNIRKSNLPSPAIMVKYFDSVIYADSSNIEIVLSAVKKLNNVQDL